MEKQGVIGVGSPIVDLIAQVDESFLTDVPGDKGGMVMIEPAELNALLDRLQDVEINRTPGGSAGNTLFDLSHFGVPTALLGTTGNDDAGDFYRAELEKAGGSLHALRVSEHTPTGHCVCLVTPDAQRTMRPSLAAALEFDPADVTVDDFDGYAIAHIEGYLLAHPADKLEHLLKTAQSAGCKISLDLASFEVVKAFRTNILSLLECYVDIVFANSDEGAALYPGLTPEEQLSELRKLCSVAVVKLGADGALAAAGKEKVFIPAEKVEAVDTTAAGDSFAAGFLYGILQDWPIAQCGKFGAAVAAETVQVFGSALSDEAWERLKNIN